jgi:hypothetical protein
MGNCGSKEQQVRMGQNGRFCDIKGRQSCEKKKFVDEMKTPKGSIPLQWANRRDDQAN